MSMLACQMLCAIEFSEGEYVSVGFNIVEAGQQPNLKMGPSGVFVCACVCLCVLSVCLPALLCACVCVYVSTCVCVY